MKNRYCAGRSLLFWGALALVALAGYECWARLDTMLWALEGVYRLSVNERIPFARALSYFDPQMFYLVGYLVACVVVGLGALLFRNRPMAGYFFILAMLLLGYWAYGSLGIFGAGPIGLIQALKAVPMAMILVGSIVNLIQFYVRLHRKQRKSEQELHEPS